ncbi:McrC family protein [Fibrobacter sp. UWB3]|uniref:McrC family protein n=1 Tax=Fibrobacter sp. UWB3 TaxID=1964357 RepID=UPI000B526833|nr:hypothetical protein [Fibrobacter sp. UWB3]OWV19263.1 hypothetical protein B7991_08400 [Fibrobacter sp. UWB3]
MTLKLNLEDSHFSDPLYVSEESKKKGVNHEWVYNSTIASLVHSAIDSLQNQFETGEIKILPLRHSVTANDLNESPVWCRTKDAERKLRSGQEKITFYTSHYIGNCTINEVSIAIQPRFGDRLFNYFLGEACNIYLPKGNANYAEGNVGNAYWLIGLLWKAMLERALTSGQIPKEYKTETKNIKTFKGRLHIQKHIKANLVNQSRFFCTYRKLTMDNIINQTIRYAFSILKEKGLGSVLSDLASYDNKLASFGVTCPEIDSRHIDRIKYTKMNFVYKPVMEFSKAIISRHLAESLTNSQKMAETAFFVDMAELWEMFLLRVLQKKLDDDYNVYSPNLSAGAFLLEDENRAIRPDIIIEKDNRAVMIIDAKYKRYKTLGKTSKDPYAVSREDLYQMTTYLYHYGKDNQPIYGLFVSPANCDKGENIQNMRQENSFVNMEIKKLEHNPLHKIGLVNVEIERASDQAQLEQLEASFAGLINETLKLLQNVMPS